MMTDLKQYKKWADRTLDKIEWELGTKKELMQEVKFAGIDPKISKRVLKESRLD